jgi:hypothetical protein
MPLTSLLIECAKVIHSEKHRNLLSRIGEIPKTTSKCGVGLILIIEQSLLDNLDQVRDKKDYIGTQEFISGIVDSTWILYYKNRKRCEILQASAPYAKLIIQALKNEPKFPKNLTIIIQIPHRDLPTIQEYIRIGFKDPYYVPQA